MTTLSYWAVGAGLSLALAAAPAAQVYADDADAPGSPIVHGPASGAADVDDRDPGYRPVEAPAGDSADPVNDQDDPKAGYRLALDPTVLHVDLASPWAGTADDGRTGAAPLATAGSLGTVDLRTAADLPDGRTGAPLGASTFRARYTGPLDDGRPEGARRPAVVDAEGLDVAPAAEAALDARPSEGLSLEAVRPNPARDHALIAFTVDVRSRAVVTVYDVRGRQVAVAFDGVAEPGLEALARFEALDVAPGTYVAVLAVGERRVSRTFQVVR